MGSIESILYLRPKPNVRYVDYCYGWWKLERYCSFPSPYFVPVQWDGWSVFLYTKTKQSNMRATAVYTNAEGHSKHKPHTSEAYGRLHYAKSSLIV